MLDVVAKLLKNLLIKLFWKLVEVSPESREMANLTLKVEKLIEDSEDLLIVCSTDDEENEIEEIREKKIKTEIREKRIKTEIDIQEEDRFEAIFQKSKRDLRKTEMVRIKRF